MTTAILGPSLADAIVAYRERRPVLRRNPTTNNWEVVELNYDADRRTATAIDGTTTGTVRGGPAFVSIGELANLTTRPNLYPPPAVTPSPPPPAPVAGDRAYQIDAPRYDAAAALNPATNDYLHAIARLAAITDWVTTRSHVFTVYGVIRGQGNAQAVDARAIRFQETIDRLPAVFGEPPKTIGERVVEPYVAQP
jgi:hypothetical protein